MKPVLLLLVVTAYAGCQRSGEGPPPQRPAATAAPSRSSDAGPALRAGERANVDTPGAKRGASASPSPCEPDARRYTRIADVDWQNWDGFHEGGKSQCDCGPDRSEEYCAHSCESYVLEQVLLGDLDGDHLDEAVLVQSQIGAFNAVDTKFAEIYRLVDGCITKVERTFNPSRDGANLSSAVIRDGYLVESFEPTAGFTGPRFRMSWKIIDGVFKEDMARRETQE